MIFCCKNNKIRVFYCIAIFLALLGGFVGRNQIKGKIIAVSQKWNQLHAYDYPAENNGWVKYSKHPVYGNLETGPMFDPYVWTSDSCLMMCVSERKTGSLIALSSKEGIKWMKVSTMLSPRKNTWEDIVNRGCVVKVNNLYYLYYTGQKRGNMGGQSAIGIAVSIDGLKYNRIFVSPILRPETEIEKQSVMNPCVLYNKVEKKFKMWYAAGETYEPDVICYAESKDGIHWKKRITPVLSKNTIHEWEQEKVGGCQVLKTRNGYEMYYIGYQNVDVARVCYATSKDGIRWNRNFSNLLLSPSRGNWDAEATYKPTVYKQKDKIMLWYNGRKGGEEYIGLAIKRLK